MITTLATGGDVPLELVDGQAPTEIRLLRRGVNPSTKGEFIFDDAEAKAVMDAYEAMGRAWVIADYDHGSLQRNPIDPGRSSRAAGRARLELRAGDLWAVDIKWTPEAKAGIEAGEWPSISPAFEHDEAGRISWLINFGLTGNPALFGPAELIAANVLRAALAAVGEREPAIELPLVDTNLPAAAGGGAPAARVEASASAGPIKETTMKTPAELAAFLGCTEEQAKMILDQMAEMMSGKKPSDAMMSAVALAIGADASKPQALLGRASELHAFAGEVQRLTGQTSVQGALGAVDGLLKTKLLADQQAATIADLNAKTVAAELVGILSDGKASAKITKAELDDRGPHSLYATALAKATSPIGKPEDGATWLKANIAQRATITTLTVDHRQPNERTEGGSGEPKTELGGRKWEALSNKERADLHASDRATYDAMRADWQTRGRPLKAA